MTEIITTEVPKLDRHVMHVAKPMKNSVRRVVLIAHLTRPLNLLNLTFHSPERMLAV